MVKHHRSVSLFRSLWRKFFRHPAQARRLAPRHRLVIEGLESRITPSTLYENAAHTALTIAFSANQESLSLVAGASSITITDSSTPTLDASVTSAFVTVSGNTATITTAGIAAYTKGFTIADVDTHKAGKPSFVGTTVAFADSVANAYTIPATVRLTNAESGDITFSGANTFTNQSLSATTLGGTIISTTGSSLSLTGAGNLTLSAGNDLVLIGTVSVAGTTTLTSGTGGTTGSALTALDGSNNFAGGLSFNAKNGPVNINNSGALTLGNSTYVNHQSTGPDSQITAGGNITQTGTLTGASTAVALDFTSTGNITLDNTGNNFGFEIGLNVSGSNNITLVNNGTASGNFTDLGNITLASGALQVTSEDSIEQAAGTTITTSGAATFDVATTSGSIDIFNFGNNIAGAVVFSDDTPAVVLANGTLTDVSFQNVNPAASVPTLTLAAGHELVNYILRFDSTAIALPAVTISGHLSVAAGGALTQTGVLAAGSASFAVLGNYPITLTSGNTITGGVSFDSSHSSQPVAFANSVGLILGTSTLGLGTFSVTATTGDITTSAAGSLTQEPGAGVATFTATAGTTVDLRGANDFVTPVTIAGAAVSTVDFRNTDPLATVDALTLPATVTQLTVTLDAAVAVFDKALTLTNLTVTAQGIIETTGGALTVTGASNQATFDAGAFPINLGGANNLNNVKLSNSGRNNVTINTTGTSPLNFTGTSALGTGRLIITANGTGTAGGISEATGARISQPANAGPINLVSMNGPITLDQHNGLTGQINITAGPNITLSNSSGDLLLGTIATSGTATLTATSESGSILQAPGTALSLAGGADSFNAATGIALGNQGNTFSGAVALTATSTSGDDAVLVSASAVQLGSVDMAGNQLSVTAAGAITQAASTAIVNVALASLNAGANNITLTKTGNSIHGLDLSSTGSAVSIADTGTLTLHQVTLGITSLTLTTSGNISEAAGGAVTQTGAAPISLTAGTAFTDGSVSLRESGNNLLGTVTVANPGNGSGATPGNILNVVLDTIGALVLATGTGNTITGTLNLTAGGALDLTTHSIDLTQLVGLTISANTTTISSNITTSTAGVSITGSVTLATGASGLTIDTSAGTGNVSFNGNVTVSGTSGLTFNIADNRGLLLAGGTWNEGTNNLTLADNASPSFGHNVHFGIGNTHPNANLPPVFVMSGGTISMPGEGDIDVAGSARLTIGSAGGATVTLSDGSGSLVFEDDSVFEVGLGALASANSQLIKQGSGDIQISSLAHMVTDGLAPTTPSPVLSTTTQGGAIVGAFDQSVQQDQNGHAVVTPFFAGSDIVLATPTADASGEHITVAQAGNTAGLTANGPALVTVSTTGTFNGTTAAGDLITVTSSLGASAGLVVLQDSSGFDVVIRSTANTANTLTISTTQSTGSGFSSIHGIAVNTAGAVTISASTANIFNPTTSDAVATLETAGSLAALTAHILGSGSNGATSITDGSNSATTMTANVIANTLVHLQGALTTLSATSVDLTSAFTAASFGNIITTGNTATLNPGNFGADLFSLMASGTVVGKATIAGDLTGTWDVGGAVGPVTAAAAGGAGTFWKLGTSPGANVSNGGALTNVGILNLGLVNNLTINASGNLPSLTALAIDETVASSTASIKAQSVGSITTTGSVALAASGDISGLTLLLTGNAGGTAAAALGKLTAAGNLINASITAENGNIGTISVTQGISGSSITANTVGNSGALAGITAGQVVGSTITAKSLASLKAAGDLPAGLFGDITTTTISLSGLSGNAVALGTLSAAGEINSSTLNVQNGSVGSISGAEGFNSDTFTLDDAAAGNLGSLSAGQWTGTDVTALTIGSITVTGVAQAFTRTGGLAGDLTHSTLVAFALPGTSVTPATTSIAVAGSLNTDFISIPNGIDKVAVGQNIVGTEIVADGVAAAPAVKSKKPPKPPIGSIAALTAGSINGLKLTANSLGTVNVTGFSTAASPGNPGNVINSTIVVNATGLTGTSAITSFTVQHDVSGTTLTDQAGIGSVSVGGTFRGTFLLGLGSSKGVLGTLSAAAISGATVDATSIGTLTATGSSAFKLLGNISNSNITARQGTAAKAAIGTLSATGSFTNDSLLTPGQLTTFSVAGAVAGGSNATFAAGFAAASTGTVTGITNLSAGSWTGDNLTTTSIGTFKVTGNTATGQPGNVTGSTFDILGATGGVGLGTFSTTATITGTTFNVLAGNVTSFTAGALSGSNVLVGVVLSSQNDPAHGTATFQTFAIGSFKTTGVFDPTDILDTASFVDSNIVAAKLGKVALAGVDVNSENKAVASFGVFFSNASTSNAGTVTADGSATPLTPSPSPQSIGTPPASGQFFYEGK
jgi:hypothetical protein